MITFSELKELEQSKQLTVDIDWSKVPMFDKGLVVNAKADKKKR